MFRAHTQQLIPVSARHLILQVLPEINANRIASTFLTSPAAMARAPMKVQQELMRHASIQTTMNVYGQAMTSSKREANGKVVEMVLKPVKASA